MINLNKEFEISNNRDLSIRVRVQRNICFSRNSSMVYNYFKNFILWPEWPKMATRGTQLARIARQMSLESRFMLAYERQKKGYAVS